MDSRSFAVLPRARTPVPGGCDRDSCSDLFVLPPPSRGKISSGPEKTASCLSPKFRAWRWGLAEPFQCPGQELHN